MMERIGDFALTWGESLRWDDRRQRLYFVDCATRVLHWLDDGALPLHTLQLPTLPTGVVLTEGTELVVCLDEGLHVVDPDAGTWRLLAAYPSEMEGRANDANADGAGNLVTGTLNVTAAPGSLWWFSATEGWRLLDADFGNTNGPAFVDFDGRSTLVCADTISRAVYAYTYDAEAGRAMDRRVIGDHSLLDGSPDGAAADADDGVWSCVLGSGKLARLTNAGVDRVIDVPVAYPSDVAFGGSDLGRLYATSIAVELVDGVPPGPEAGSLLFSDDVGVTGRADFRFSLA